MKKIDIETNIDFHKGLIKIYREELKYHSEQIKELREKLRNENTI